MERRGVYRKGSAGHVRNINAYRLSMQRIKRWKSPIFAILGVIMVFGMTPIVGDQFQASLLTTDEQVQLKASNPAALKKTLLVVLKDFVDDCDRFKMKECVDRGRKLMNEIGRVQPVDAASYIPAAEDFAATFEEKVALNACKYDLGNALIQAQSSQKVLDDFLEEYGDALDVKKLMPSGDNINTARGILNSFVNSCELRLIGNL